MGLTDLRGVSATGIKNGLNVIIGQGEIICK
jgi:hypothetical protein